MPNRSRELREAVIRALAKVGLVWALAVLGALFMAMTAHGLQHDAGDSPASADRADASAAFVISSGQAPRTAGLALALVVLSSGLTVLAVGAARGEGRTDPLHVPEPERAPDFPLVLGLGLLPDAA